MILFCVLWIPVFYLFWLTLRPVNSNSGGLYALLAGGVAALVRFFIPSFVDDVYGFGLWRYLSAFIDYVSLPVLIPMIAAKLIVWFYPRSGITDYTGFTLLALIPSALVFSTAWSASRDALRMVLTPLLWTALVFAFYSLIRLSGNVSLHHKIPQILRKIAAILGMAAYTLLLPFVWWNFFGQNALIGIILLIPSLAPMITVCILFLRKKYLEEAGIRENIEPA
jgi:hypothetical protein